MHDAVSSGFFPGEFWTISHIDEYCEAIDYDADIDLLGLTFHTPSAPHAYEIADRFQKKGVYTIMGGPHVSIAPEDALPHADSI
jgi:radical SAM superfamily enzyme YgiQ (UPF0313 family)